MNSASTNTESGSMVYLTLIVLVGVVIRLVPETKGKTLEEIEQHWVKPDRILPGESSAGD